jgi:hypothetical protein
METFAPAIEGWHDFYLMIGTASATLIGLLFVSLSLNVDVMIRKENADLRMLATHTFGNFMSVLMFAVLFLIPHQVPAGLGLPLLGVGGYGLYTTVSRWLETRHKPAHVWDIEGGVARRFVIPIFCFGTLVIIAATVLMGWTGGLYWLVPVMILLIVAASRNAWDLLLRLREPPDE